jgi:hypothetical protein
VNSRPARRRVAPLLLLETRTEPPPPVGLPLSQFGSICLGSLLIALVQLLYDIVESSRAQQQDGFLSALLWCCVACCLGYLKMLVELFNREWQAAPTQFKECIGSAAHCLLPTCRGMSSWAEIYII